MMWIRPLSIVARGTDVSLNGAPTMPLPPWSGVPVALDIEVSADVLTAALALKEVGQLHALSEDGDDVQCAAIVDQAGSHTCEHDSVLRIVQCGPFEYPDAPDGNG